MKQLFASVLTVVTLCSSLFSADFLQPVQARDLTKSPKVTVTSKTGKTTGRVVSTDGSGVYLSSFKIESETGATKTITASSNVSVVAIVPGLMETELLEVKGMAAGGTSRTGTHKLRDGEPAKWNSVVLPSGKAVISMVLNPGFDNVYRIYSASEEPSLDHAEEFVAERDGEVFTVSKKRYRSKNFERLFGDSKSFMKKFENRKIEWKDFPEHLQLYDHYRKDNR